MSRASTRSPGTSTRPARWHRPGGRTRPAGRRRSSAPPSGARAPERTRTARPGPGPRARRRPSTSPGRSSKETSCELACPAAQARGPRGAATRGARADPASPARAPSAGGGIGGCRLVLGDGSEHQAPRCAPPRPGRMSTTPTVSPSRRTVARSQSALISSSRWEMKMTERPRLALAADLVEDAARSGRPAGRRSSRRGAARRARSPGPREVHDAQDRPAAGRGRCAWRSRSRARPSSAMPADGTARPASRQAQVGRDVEVGDERRLLVDGHEAAAPRLGRGVDVARPGRGRRCGRRRGGRHPVRILTRVRLAGAVGAHERVHLARAGRPARRRAAPRTAPYAWRRRWLRAAGRRHRLGRRAGAIGRRCG